MINMSASITTEQRVIVSAPEFHEKDAAALHKSNVDTDNTSL